MAIRVVMLGDIVGRPGRQAVAQLMPQIRDRIGANVVVANAENAANGAGLTPSLYKKLCDAGVDAMTLGDHTYRKLEIVRTLESEANIIRPANLPTHAKGKGWMRIPLGRGKRDLFVVTLLGRMFMNSMVGDDPFAAIDRILAQLPEANPMVIVEIHAEATSEKQALGWHLNGRVAMVAGTHTHVATADVRLLPRIPAAGYRAFCDVSSEPSRTPTGIVSPDPSRGGAVSVGTGYITDLGMCGSQRSVIGRQIEPVLTKMTTSMPARFDVAQGDPRVCGVCVDIDETTGLAVHIERFELKADPTATPFVAASWPAE